MLTVRSLHHFLFLTFFIHSLLTGEGFVAGTLVKTPYGYAKIDELAVGDSILCNNFDGTFTTSTIIRTYKKLYTRLIRLVVDHTIIYVEPHHLFYLPCQKRWCKASELCNGGALLKGIDDTVIITDIHETRGALYLYDISVDTYHTFYVSQEDITVHNAIGELLSATFYSALSSAGVPTLGVAAAEASAVSLALAAAAPYIIAVGGAAVSVYTVYQIIDGFRGSLTERHAHHTKTNTIKADHYSNLPRWCQELSNHLVGYETHDGALIRVTQRDGYQLREMHSFDTTVATPKHYAFRPSWAKGPTTRDNPLIIVIYCDSSGTPLTGDTLAQAKKHDRDIRITRGEIIPRISAQQNTNHSDSSTLLTPTAQEDIETTISPSLAVIPHEKSEPGCFPLPVPLIDAHQGCFEPSPLEKPSPGCGPSTPITPNSVIACFPSEPIPPLLIVEMAKENTQSIGDLESAPSIQAGINRGLEIIGSVDPTTGIPHIGRQGVIKDYIVGRSYHDGKVIIRLDHDEKIGTHINVTDYRNGKSTGAIEKHIVVPEGEEQLLAFIKHYNTAASLNAAKAIFEKADDTIKDRGLTAVSEIERQQIFNKLGNHGSVYDDWKP